MIVTARGTIDDDEITVTAQPLGIEIIDSGADFLKTTSADSHDTVVLVVDFQDSPVPCSDSQIADSVFTGVTSVNGLYQETSFGLVSFPGDTDGNGQPDVFRVSIDATTGEGCNYSAWTAAADTAAQNAGIDLGLYRHRVYVLPLNAGCTWAGMANIGCGTLCRAWIRMCHLPDVYAHELGHNLGMHHSSTDTDNDGSMNCDYCDTSDVMGMSGQGWRQVNGPHKDQMGWIPTEQILTVQDQGSQTLVISPLETDPALALYPQLLKIYEPAKDTYYYLSYRIATGYDATLNSSYVDRTSVHTYAGSGSVRTLFLQALADGETFVDETDDIEITQLAHDSVSATVLLSVGCSAMAPTTTAAPATRRGLPGEEVTYNVTVVNNDSVSCGTSIFDVAANVPPGWSGTVAAPVLVLAPGEQATTTLYVTSSVEATENPYPVEVQLTDPTAPAHDATRTATYEVMDAICDGPDTDLDGVTDDCDTCPSTYDPAQSDQDSDHEGDACDVDDGMIYLLFSDPSYVEWQEEWGFEKWDYYEGDLQVLRDTGVYTQLPGSNPIARQDCGLTDPWAADFDPPPAGTAAFFLVAGSSGGTSSGLGQDGQGTERPVVNACP
jgi:hypothetical protein